MNQETFNSQADRILHLLKTGGPLTAAELGQKLDLTSMGARQHLQGMEQQGLVYWQDNASGRGRPKRFWYLSDAAQKRFPDRHSELTLHLIDSVEELFGEEGLDRLISKREQQLLSSYSAAMKDAAELSERVAILAGLRCDEGYMADWTQLSNGDFVLWENHCPICAAASRCRGFCRSELELLQQVLGDDCTVKRQQYLLDGDLRCSYLIAPSS